MGVPLQSTRSTGLRAWLKSAKRGDDVDADYDFDLSESPAFQRIDVTLRWEQNTEHEYTL
jgi:hypothetical protein